MGVPSSSTTQRPLSGPTTHTPRGRILSTCNSEPGLHRVLPGLDSTGNDHRFGVCSRLFLEHPGLSCGPAFHPGRGCPHPRPANTRLCDPEPQDTLLTRLVSRLNLCLVPRPERRKVFGDSHTPRPLLWRARSAFIRRLRYGVLAHPLLNLPVVPVVLCGSSKLSTIFSAPRHRPAARAYWVTRSGSTSLATTGKLNDPADFGEVLSLSIR